MNSLSLVVSHMSAALATVLFVAMYAAAITGGNVIVPGVAALVSAILAIVFKVLYLRYQTQLRELAVEDCVTVRIHESIERQNTEGLADLLEPE